MVQYQAGCEPGPACEGQPMGEWQCPVGSQWLTRAEFEEGGRRWAAQTSSNDHGRDINQHDGGAMNNGHNEQLVENLQLRAARVAITASASRKQGAPGVVEAAREVVGGINLAKFVVESEREFVRQLDQQTQRLKSRLPAAAQSWGLARKLLNIFLRDCAYTYILRDAYGLDRIERWLEVPLDSYTAAGLTAAAKKLDESPPRWRTVKSLMPADSAEYQRVAARVADELRVLRVHLDAYWWGVRDET